MEQETLGQTKSCPKCGEQIQSSAKVCKHCKADLRNWFVRHKVITGILALMLIGIIGGMGGENNDSENSAAPSNASDATKKEEAVLYKTNDAIKTDKFEITVTSAKEKNVVGSQYFQSNPSEGGKYKNISDKPAGPFSTPSIKLTDGNGTSYDADISASGNFATEIDLNRKIMSDLNPDITVNDASVFEVSKEQFAKGDWNILIKSDGKEYGVSLQ